MANKGMRISVFVSDKTNKQIEQAARNTGLSKSALVEVAVALHVKGVKAGKPKKCIICKKPLAKGAPLTSKMHGGKCLREAQRRRAHEYYHRKKAA
jgi:hypothetical protein